MSAAPYSVPFTIGEHLAFYAHLGFNVIPLQPARVGDKETGKRPGLIGGNLLDWGVYQHRHSTTPERLSWWPHRDLQVPDGMRGSHNIGIVTGRISKLIVIDIDDEDSYAQIMTKVPKLEDDFTVKSGRGYHIYLRPNTEDAIATTTFRLNGHLHHVKAEGGYVVAPPSLHYSGVPYTLMVDPPRLDDGLIAAPQLRTVETSEIAEALLEMGATVVGTPEAPRQQAGWLEELLMQPINDGERHDTLKRIAGNLAYIYGPLKEGEALAWLKLWNDTRVRPRLFDKELEDMLTWAMQRERQKWPNQP